MHRQSLGSPPSKLHLHHYVAVANEEETLTSDEPPKPRRLSSPTPTPHKFIHVIPILTLLCFFVLYLFSHTPSPSDLNHFTGFSRFNHHLDSAAKMNDIIDAKRSDVLAIRSLQQIPKSRLHRKLADF